MNHLLRIGAVLFTLVCLFPPWVQTVHRGQVQGSEPLGYAWVFRPPRPKIKAEPPRAGDLSYLLDLKPDAPGSAVLSSLPDDPGLEDSFAMKGIAIGIDLARLTFEILALVALVGVGMTFARKRPA
jgi:hypothetical protein